MPKLPLLLSPSTTTAEVSVSPQSFPSSPVTSSTQAQGSAPPLPVLRKPLKRFRRRWSLIGHRCGYCTKIFNSANEKKWHVWTHTKPFKCPNCLKGYPTTSHLNRHIAKVHDAANERRHGIPEGSTSVIKRYHCKECPFTTTNDSSVFRHRKYHGAPYPHKCPECSCAFQSLQPLHTHINRVHPDSTYEINFARKMGKKSTLTTQPQIPCTICQKLISSRSGQMTAHRRLYHPEVKPYYCTECTYVSAGYSMMWQHRKTHTTPNVYTCLYCTSSHSTLSKCNFHIKRAHLGMPLIPRPKKKKKAGKGTIKKVSKKLKPRGEFKCSYCVKIFPFQSNLTRHEACHTLPFQCSQCSLRFSDKYKLKHHKIKGHRLAKLNGGRRGPKPKVDTPCPFPSCEVKVAGQEKLYEHLKIYHPTFPAFKCKECPYATADRPSLDRHLIFHRVDNVYKCGHCSASFVRLSTRDRHLASVHPGMPTDLPQDEPLEQRKVSVHPTGYYNPKEEPLDGGRDIVGEKCHVCGELVRGRTLYKLHFTSNHSGRKPYKCPDCPFETRKAWNLENHKKLHSEKNAFQCEFCSASFGNLIRKTVHINSVHKEEQPPKAQLGDDGNTGAQIRTRPVLFTCQTCQKTFPFNIALKMHGRKFHGPYTSMMKDVGVTVTPTVKERKETRNEQQGISSIGKDPDPPRLSTCLPKLPSPDSPKHRKCNHCDYTTKFPGNLKTHLRAHSAGRKGDWKCGECSARFVSRGALSTHLRYSHPSRSRSYSYNGEVPVPVVPSTQNGDKKRKIEKLNSECRNDGEGKRIRKSVVRHHQFSADQDRGTSRKGSIQTPVDPKPIQVFACGSCDGRFGKRNELENHSCKSGDESEDVEDGEIEILEVQKKTPDDVHQKEKMKEPVDPLSSDFPCPLCISNFTSQGSLTAHLEERHGIITTPAKVNSGVMRTSSAESASLQSESEDIEGTNPTDRTTRDEDTLTRDSVEIPSGKSRDRVIVTHQNKSGLKITTVRFM